jgi:hypothetical protein
MSEILWARVDKRGDKDVLVLYRRQAVNTGRGPALEEQDVFVVENLSSQAFKGFDGQPVTMEMRLAGGTAEYVSVSADIKLSDKEPVEPKIARTNFKDPESERAATSKKRGMGRYIDKESKPSGKPGSPPVPIEQRGRRGGVSSRPTNMRPPTRPRGRGGK